jgi:hypothetical protein
MRTRLWDMLSMPRTIVCIGCAGWLVLSMPHTVVSCAAADAAVFVLCRL